MKGHFEVDEPHVMLLDERSQILKAFVSGAGNVTRDEAVAGSNERGLHLEAPQHEHKRE